MLQLYYAPTPHGLRARIVLEEAGLPYRLHAVDLWKGEQRESEFRSLNPMGAIPVLVDPSGPGGGQIVITQSAAILIYLAEKVGRFIPADPALRVQMLQWFMLGVSDIAGANSAINQLNRSGPESGQAKVALFEARLHKFLAACDEHLSGNGVFAGEYSIADIAIYPFAQARRQFIDHGGLKNLLHWTDEIGRRPAVMRSMADHG